MFCSYIDKDFLTYKRDLLKYKKDFLSYTKNPREIATGNICGKSIFAAKSHGKFLQQTPTTNLRGKFLRQILR